MREINIAKVIMAKRKEKGVTQDELAEYMGVSKASVSKWETGLSYPDITFLPQLATYFNISIDELMGYSPQMTTEDINRTYHRLAEAFGRRPFDEVLDECHAVIKKYYACFPLLMRMAVLLLNYCTLAKEKVKQEALMREIIELCNRIKRESDDVWLARQANSLEAAGYVFLQQPQEVLELLDGTMKPPLGDEPLLATAYQMTGDVEKAKSVLQISLYQHLLSLFASVTPYLMMIAADSGKFEPVLERFLNLSKLFELEHLHPNTMCVLYLTAAQGYAMQSNREKALQMLENYTRVCTTALLPFKLKGDVFFDHIESWFKEFDAEAPRDEKTVKTSIVQSVAENSLFTVLHDEPEYKSILEKLRAFAG